MGYREFKDELMAGITKGYLDQAASDADKYVPSLIINDYSQKKKSYR